MFQPISSQDGGNGQAARYNANTVFHTYSVGGKSVHQYYLAALNNINRCLLQKTEIIAKRGTIKIRQLS